MNTEGSNQNTSHKVLLLPRLEEMKSYDYVPHDILRAVVGSTSKNNEVIKKRKKVASRTKQKDIGDHGNTSSALHTSFTEHEHKKTNKLLSLILNNNIDKELITKPSHASIDYDNEMKFLKEMRIQFKDFDLNEKYAPDDETTPPLEHLLSIIKEESDIYNTIFLEVIKQVSKGSRERGEMLSVLRNRYAGLLQRVTEQVEAFQKEVLAQTVLNKKISQQFHFFSCNLEKVLNIIKKAICENDEVRRWITALKEQQNKYTDELPNDIKVANTSRKLFLQKICSFENQIQLLQQKCNLWQKVALEISTNFHTSNCKTQIAAINEWEIYARQVLTTLQQLIVEKLERMKNIRSKKKILHSYSESNIKTLHNTSECEVSSLCADITMFICDLLYIIYLRNQKHTGYTSYEEKNNEHIAHIVKLTDLTSRIHMITERLRNSVANILDEIEPENLCRSQLFDLCKNIEKSSLALIESLKETSHFIMYKNDDDLLESKVSILESEPSQRVNNVKQEVNLHDSSFETPNIRFVDEHDIQSVKFMSPTQTNAGATERVDQTSLQNILCCTQGESSLGVLNVHTTFTSELPVYQALEIALASLKEAETRVDIAEQKVLELELKIQQMEGN